MEAGTEHHDIAVHPGSVAGLKCPPVDQLHFRRELGGAVGGPDHEDVAGPPVRQVVASTVGDRDRGEAVVQKKANVIARRLYPETGVRREEPRGRVDADGHLLPDDVLKLERAVRCPNPLRIKSGETLDSLRHVRGSGIVLRAGKASRQDKAADDRSDDGGGRPDGVLESPVHEFLTT